MEDFLKIQNTDDEDLLFEAFSGDGEIETDLEITFTKRILKAKISHEQL